MKELRPVEFDPAQLRAELDQLHALLASKTELSERDDIQPFFKARVQLSAYVGAVLPGLCPADLYAFEFDVFGDYTADLMVGNVDQRTYCAVEFEDARPNSVLHATGRSQKEWGRRLEHGFGQLVDWFFAFDDHRNTAGFWRHFGPGHIEFYGLLLIGRSAHLTDHDRYRLRWRSSRVSINTHKIACFTYDDLAATLEQQWRAGSLYSTRPESDDE
jgi:hypothetical protein